MRLTAKYGHDTIQERKRVERKEKTWEKVRRPIAGLAAFGGGRRYVALPLHNIFYLFDISYGAFL